MFQTYAELNEAENHETQNDTKHRNLKTNIPDKRLISADHIANESVTRWLSLSQSVKKPPLDIVRRTVLPGLSDQKSAVKTSPIGAT